MGLSSKQVSTDGFDWSKALLQVPKLPSCGMKRSQQSQQQNQIQPPEQLKCPRCDSTNTKFCYYNNYNKSQPRHFCRTCKRHWTKGGTLRNVPVGGGRKNKRLKKSTTPAAATTKSSAAVAAATKSNIDGVLNSQMSVQAQNPRQNLPLALGRDQKNLSDFLYQGLVFPPSSLSLQNFKDSGNWPECENLNADYGILNTQMNIQPQNPNISAVSSSTSFEANHSPISTSFQSPNICNYTDQDFKPIEIEPTITSFPHTTTTGTRISTHPWLLPTTTSCGTDMPSCLWSWDEIDTFAATDLNIPWDDRDIKP